MKKAFQLTVGQLAEMVQLLNKPSLENTQKAIGMWTEIGRALGFDPKTVSVATTNNPQDFMAEPVAAAVPVNDQDRGQWTSASSAPADALCAGRHLAQVGIADEPKGEDASFGNRVHAALSGSDSFAAMNLGLEERECFDACRELEKKLFTQYFGETHEDKVKTFREVRRWVRLTVNGKPVAHSGQPDLVWRCGSKALVIDYKTLRGDVPESAANQQLRDLAVLTWRNLGLINEVATAIVQPMVTRTPELCIYTEADLQRAEVEMFERIGRSNDPASPRTPGVVQCKYCKARNKCVEHTQWIGSQLPVVSAEPMVQEGVFKFSMEQWTPEQRSTVADLLPTLNKRLDEIKDWLKDGLTKDVAFIPGWKLKDGSVREEIKDPQALFDRFAGIGGTLPQFFPCIKVQKGELKKAVASVTGAKGKALDGEMDKLTDGITESKQSAPTLVKDGGK